MFCKSWFPRCCMFPRVSVTCKRGEESQGRFGSWARVVVMTCNGGWFREVRASADNRSLHFHRPPPSSPHPSEFDASRIAVDGADDGSFLRWAMSPHPSSDVRRRRALAPRRAVVAFLQRAPRSPSFGSRTPDPSGKTPGCRSEVSSSTLPKIWFVILPALGWFPDPDCSGTRGEHTKILANRSNQSADSSKY
jgi:hypothetical protein